MPPPEPADIPPGGFIAGIGIDLVENARIERAIARHGDRFLRRLFTEGEIAYCAGRVAALAARFAAKEAVAKAFGTGIGEAMTFREIEVTHSPTRQPLIRFHGTAKKTAQSRGVSAVWLSLTHTEHFAAAQVVLTVDQAPDRPESTGT
ncbi:MAG: holo-ACP synthase [Verrucomicrobiales bacterium]